MATVKICMPPHDRESAEPTVQGRTGSPVQGSESQLRHILHHAPVAVAVLRGRELEYVSANRAYRTVVGSDVPLIGRTHGEVFPEGEAADRRARMLEVLRTGRPWKVRDVRVEVPGRDGATWWDGECLPLPNERGEIDSVVVLAWEITDRKEAEDALRESEGRYRALVETQAEMLCRFRPDGEILFVNEAYARAHGTKAEELIGRPFWDLILEEDHPHVRAMLDRLTPEAPEIRIENRLRTVDGVRWTMWTNLGLAFGADGRLLEAQSTGIDITRRKLAEQALTARLGQLETIYRLSAALSRADEVEEIVEAAMDGIIDAVSADRASVLLFDAEGVMRFRGWRGLSEAYRRAVDGHSPWTPSDVDARPITIGDAAADESLADLHDVVLDEGIRALAFIPLVSSGRLVGKFMVYYDRPRELTEQEMHVCETIGGHVAYAIERARTQRALREGEERLREADRRKDEFLATLGHELRNPLAPLHNMLQVMRRADLDAELLRRARDTMERQVEQLVRLVDDLLDVNRISRGEIRLRKERVELADLVSRTVQDVRSSGDEGAVEWEIALPQEPLHLDADPVRLSQVVDNLLRNARKYTGPGGRIRVAVERAAGHAVVRVRDTGVGIEAERLPRIFDMFYRSGAGADGAQAGGLGIGLALVKNLVELHEGEVEGYSAGPDRGSEFTVRLPLGEAAGRPPAEVPAEPEPEPPPSRRILVVDDNRDAAHTLATLLEGGGHRVHVAFDGSEAIRAAEELELDVILLDIGLPELDGYEVARRIRAQSPRRDLLLFALTGWSQEEDRRRSKEAGFDAHLVKPLDIAEFARLVRSMTP